MEQQDLLASVTMDQEFPGKAFALQHVFYLAVALKKKTLKQTKEPKTKSKCLKRPIPISNFSAPAIAFLAI